MACALCLQDEPLCNSHIVPEFMHREIYDEKHRFLGISNNPSKPVKFFQKGLREPLLCRGCETKLNHNERYARKCLYGGTPLAVQQRGKEVSVSGVDYKRMKLFLMSILWRFAVTTIEGFKGVKLGPHREKLRQLVLAEDPGEPFRYGCAIIEVVYEDKRIPGLIMQPTSARLGSHRIWRIIVDGLLLLFCVSNHDAPAEIRPLFLKPDGSMLILLEELTKLDFLYRYACELADANRLRKQIIDCVTK